jgi:hypothetical protein
MVENQKLGKKARRGLKKAAEAAKLQADGTPKVEITPEEAVAEHEAAVAEATNLSENGNVVTEVEQPVDDVSESAVEQEAPPTTQPETREPVKEEAPPAPFAALAAEASGEAKPTPKTEPAKKAPARSSTVEDQARKLKERGLTMQQFRVLKALANNRHRALTRKQLQNLCDGQKKGWSLLLGATTREEGSKGLVHLGYVAVAPGTEGSSIAYLITEKGMQVYEAAVAAKTLPVPVGQEAQPKQETEAKQTA